MELGLFWGSVRQRWYLVLAIVLLTAGATYLVAQRVGPAYEATGTVLVFPPSQTRGPSGETMKGNPYLGLGGVTHARDVLVRTLTSKSVGDEFDARFPAGTSFEIVPDYTNSAPIILFTVEAPAPETSVAALQMLINRVPQELDELQAGLSLPVAQRVTSLVLTQDERPAATHKAQIRAAILSAAVLAGSGLLLIALVDGLLTGRRRTRTSQSPPPERGPTSGGRLDEAPSDGTARTASRRGSPARMPRPKATGVVTTPVPTRQRTPAGAGGDAR